VSAVTIIISLVPRTGPIAHPNPARLIDYSRELLVTGSQRPHLPYEFRSRIRIVNALPLQSPQVFIHLHYQEAVVEGRILHH